MLPAVILPVPVFNVPAILAPVLVTVKTFAVPATLIVTLAFGATATLLFPSAILVTVMALAEREPVIVTFARIVLPVIFAFVALKLASVPTLVMFG